MKAIQIKGHGDTSQMNLVELDKPEPKEGEILVKMLYASINPCDMDVTAGQLPFAKEPPLILGTEGTGIVEVGTDEFPTGTAVIVSGGLLGIVQDGTWTEYKVVTADQLHKMPRGVSTWEAAGMPLVYLTAQAAMLEGGFESGSSALITGAGGGVGNAAYQLALMQGANKVIATVGSPEKKEKLVSFIDKLFIRPVMWESIKRGTSDALSVSELRDFHRKAVIDLSTEDFEARVRELTDGRGPQFSLDVLGGDYLPRILDLAAPGGAIAMVGYKAGMVAPIVIMPILAKQLRLFGTNVFNLSPELTERAYSIIFDIVQKHSLRPLVAKRFPLAEAAKATEFMMNDRPFGKVILNIAGDA